MGFIVEHDTNEKVAVETRQYSVVIHYDEQDIDIHYEDLDDVLELVLERTKIDRATWRKP